MNWTHLLPQEYALAFLYEVILGMVAIGNLTEVKRARRKFCASAKEIDGEGITFEHEVHRLLRSHVWAVPDVQKMRRYAQ